MERSPALPKLLANDLARLIMSKNGARTVRLLKQAGLLQIPSNNCINSHVTGGVTHPPNRLNEEPAAGPPDRIGIWDRRQENGETYFVRRKESSRDWNFWANVGRIAPKRDKRRVLWIGESVARGFLYDPEFTPASALGKVLQKYFGDNKIEVIDLARTNLGFEVEELAIAALALEPDIAFIFSGNNLSAGISQPREFALIEATVAQNGVPALKQFGERYIAARVRDLVEKVGYAYRKKQVPLVWIIPEFNLADWHDSVTNAPYLPEGDNAEWINLRLMAEAALEAGDLGTAVQAAEKMVALDGGTSVAGLYTLAECSRRSFDLESTRRYLEMARDAAMWDTSKNNAPRPFSVTQNMLREHACEYSDGVVDLPSLFAGYLDGELPGRRLFLDYCHLSSEGLRIVTSAAAGWVLDILKNERIPWGTLMTEVQAPSDRIEAEASFVAAIHNAHWWQGPGLIRHYCSRAIQYWPGISSIMHHFIDLQTRRSPTLICRSAEQIAALGSPLIQHYLLRFNYQRLDTVLIESLIATLAAHGSEIRHQVDDLRREQHSVGRHEINLLDYYYCSDVSQQQEVMWAVRHLGGYAQRKVHHYYRAYWLKSKFVFIADTGRMVQISLTCRSPEPARPGSAVSLSVNSTTIAEIEVTRDWETWHIVVPAEIVKAGTNEIVIQWPLPVFPGVNPLDATTLDLMELKYPELFPAFGEIHSLVASDVKTCPTTLRLEDADLNLKEASSV